MAKVYIYYLCKFENELSIALTGKRQTKTLQKYSESYSVENKESRFTRI